jgi:hypothetical protein
MAVCGQRNQVPTRRIRAGGVAGSSASRKARGEAREERLKRVRRKREDVLSLTRIGHRESAILEGVTVLQ